MCARMHVTIPSQRPRGLPVVIFRRDPSVRAPDARVSQGDVRWIGSPTRPLPRTHGYWSSPGFSPGSPYAHPRWYGAHPSVPDDSILHEGSAGSSDVPYTGEKDGALQASGVSNVGFSPASRPYLRLMRSSRPPHGMSVGMRKITVATPCTTDHGKPMM